MRTVGWGIIGCSDIVKKRAGAAIAAQPNSKLIAFHSRNQERGAAYAREFGASSTYTDPRAFLRDERIDIVYVATEVDRHAELTIAAANAGKHVLVEKPMALDRPRCDSMLEAADRNGVRLAVAYYARFLDKAKAMKTVIAEGGLGQIVRVNVRIVSYYNPSTTDPKYWRVSGTAGGNVLADIGSHRLDMLTYFMGRPTRVCGFADRLSMSYEAADTETALVQFENGAHVTVLANANVPHSGGGTSIEIFGTQGALLTDPWQPEPIRIVGGNAEPITTSLPSNQHYPMIDDFASAIAAGRAPRFSGIDGMWATAVIHGVYESSRTGKIVSIAH